METVLNKIALACLLLLSMTLIQCEKDPDTTGLDNNRQGVSFWEKEDCYGSPVDVEGPIDEYTAGLWTMAVTGNQSQLRRELRGAKAGGSIPSGLGDDPENARYAARITVDGYIIAMYHPTSAAPDHFIVYQPGTRMWWRYDVGNSEKTCEVTLINQS